MPFRFVPFEFPIGMFSSNTSIVSSVDQVIILHISGTYYTFSTLLHYCGQRLLTNSCPPFCKVTKKDCRNSRHLSLVNTGCHFISYNIVRGCGGGGGGEVVGLVPVFRSVLVCKSSHKLHCLRNFGPHCKCKFLIFKINLK